MRKRKTTTKAMTTNTGTVPVLLDRVMPLGTEHIGAEDVHMPRLVLAQAISNEVTKSHADFLADLEVGDFFNSVSGHIYGAGPLRFSVLVAHRPRGVELAPLSEGGGIIDPNVPLTDPRLAFGADGSPPQATKFYDYVLWLHDTGELIAMSLARSAIKSAKSLNGLIRMRALAVWTGIYTVESVTKRSTHGAYMSWRFRNDGTVSDDQALEFAKIHTGLVAATVPDPSLDDVAV